MCNGVVDVVPDPESSLFDVLLCFLKLLKRLVLLVPKAIEQNVSVSRCFACRVLILTSYRFPSFRSLILNRMEEIIPSRYHMDVQMMDIVSFRTPSRSLCDKYEDSFQRCFREESQSDSLERVPSRYMSLTPRSESCEHITSCHDSKPPRTRSRENLHSLTDTVIPPPYVMKPLVEFMNVDKSDGIDKEALDAKKAFKKKMNHGGKKASDAAEDSNPFATSSSSSLLKGHSLKSTIEDESSQDFRYPSLCVIPFFELSRFVRSRGMEKMYHRFVKNNPDFFLWGSVADILGDEYINDIPMEWTEKWVFLSSFMSRFLEPQCLLHQFLSTFIEFAEEFSINEPMKRESDSECSKSGLFWEGIPGSFMYLQLFFTVFQYDIIRRSSKFIMMSNAEGELCFHCYASECVYVFVVWVTE